MPETMTHRTGPDIPAEEVPVVTSAHSRTGFFSTAYSGAALLETPISTGPVADDSAPAGSKSEDPESPWFRINWEIKALVPIACVLLGGMLLFLLATLSWRDPERHIVLLRGPLWVVPTYPGQRPMVNLQKKTPNRGGGALRGAVIFPRRNDEIGD